VSLPAPVVTGCMGPGSTASVSLSATVSPPGAASSFGCTVTTPAGTAFTKTTPAPTTNDGVTDGPWTNTSTGATGPLDLTVAGTYAVAVTVSGPAIPSGCTPPPPRSFTVPTCSPATPSASSGCGVLLVIAIVLLILGAILVVIGVCISVPWVWIVGAIVGAVGLLLFILWAIFCAALHLVQPDADDALHSLRYRRNHCTSPRCHCSHRRRFTVWHSSGGGMGRLGSAVRVARFHNASRRVHADVLT
jgi:hypothetical protein